MLLSAGGWTSVDLYPRPWGEAGESGVGLVLRLGGWDGDEEMRMRDYIEDDVLETVSG